MPFGETRRKEIKKKAGYFCQICGDWHPPEIGDVGSRLEAHSTDKTHEDGGLAVCGHNFSPCHQRIHDITDDPEELGRITKTAAQLNGLSMASNMLENGVPEKRIRRILGRVSDF